jgi:maleylacetate reductase
VKFTYESLPGKVRFGAGTARTHLSGALSELKIGNAMLIVSDTELERVSETINGVGETVGSTFTGVRPHVPIAVAEAAREMAATSGADGLLAIGGGSSIGTAKAVALTSGLPIVAIPTTYAGSEMTAVWGLTADGVKTTGSDRVVLPRSVLYDSDLTRSLPVDLAIASGFNALAHCVEAFWGPGANPVVTLHAAEGIRMLTEGMRELKRGSQESSTFDRVLYGSYLAGAAFAVAGSGLHHKICHVLGGAFDLPHAQTHAVILPHVLAFNGSADSIDQRALASAFRARDATAGLASLAEDLHYTGTLESLGMAPAELEHAIELVSAKLPISNPRPVGQADIASILRDSYRGAPW